MKNTILLFLMFLSLQTFGQDSVYNFNTTTEGFTSSANGVTLSSSNGAIVRDFGSYEAVLTPDLNLSEDDYEVIRIVVRNNSTFSNFKLFNLDNPGTNWGSATSVVVDIPQSTEFITHDILIPKNTDNSGIIHQLALRALGNPDGTIEIAQIVLIETGNWVTNNNFETSSNWTASGADVTAGFTTTDPQEGTQSGTLTFTADQVGNKFLQSATTDFGETVSPTDINTTLWVKSSTPGALVSLVYSLKNATGAYLGQISTGSHTISTADTWELASFNKSNLTNTFNQVLLKIKVVGGLDGTVISFDDVQPSAILVATDNSWTGGKDTEWTDIANWTNGVAPTATKDSNVQVSANNPVISATTGATVKNLDVGASAALTIASGGSLTVSGDFTNSGTVTLNSTADDFSSLIVEGTASGDIIYNRFVNVYDDLDGGGWDFVGAPTGMTIEDFITANGANIQVLGDDYAFAQYDNATGQYTRYATDTDTGSFTPAQGYALAMAQGDLPPPPAGGVAGTTVAFAGALQTTDQSINIINNDGLNNVGRRWNLVSNPFPSYIVGYDGTENPTNFLYANATAIDELYLAVYGWNGSDYTIYNNLSGAFSMAPGQGFWVAAAGTSDAALDFTAAMRTTTGTGDFIQGPQLLTYNVGLKLYNGEIERAATNFYF